MASTESSLGSLPVPLTQGGTNASLTASNGGIFYSTASAAAILSGTATASQLLLSGASTTPSWSTSTYPSTNAVSTLLYASSTNVMGALATGNDGVLITSHTGVPSWLGNGTAGQVLTANTNLPPSWQASSTGPWVLLQTITTGGATTVSFTTGITSTYNTYMLMGSNVVCSGTDGATIRLRLSSDAGATYLATGYKSGVTRNYYNSGVLFTNTNVTTSIQIGDTWSSAGVPAGSFRINLSNITNGGYPVASGEGSYLVTGNDICYCTITAYYAGALTVNAMQITNSSGTNISGTFSLYGIAQ